MICQYQLQRSFTVEFAINNCWLWLFERLHFRNKSRQWIVVHLHTSIIKQYNLVLVKGCRGCVRKEMAAYHVPPGLRLSHLIDCLEIRIRFSSSDYVEYGNTFPFSFILHVLLHSHW